MKNMTLILVVAVIGYLLWQRGQTLTSAQPQGGTGSTGGGSGAPAAKTPFQEGVSAFQSMMDAAAKIASAVVGSRPQDDTSKTL